MGRTRARFAVGIYITGVADGGLERFFEFFRPFSDADGLGFKSRVAVGLF